MDSQPCDVAMISFAFDISPIEFAICRRELRKERLSIAPLTIGTYYSSASFGYTGLNLTLLSERAI